MTGDSWVQGMLGVDVGGLGLREAVMMALPAFIVSQVTPKPLVSEMADQVRVAGLVAPAASASL